MRAASNQPWAGRTWPPSVGPRSGKHCRSQGQRGPTGGRSRGVVEDWWWRCGGGGAGPGWRPSWQCGVAANARVQPAQAPRKGLGQKRADPGPSTLGYFLKHVSESTRGGQPKSLWLDTTTRCPARQQAQQQQPRGGGGRMHGTEPGPGRHRMGGWMMGAGHGSESRPWQGRARQGMATQEQSKAGISPSSHLSLHSSEVRLLQAHRSSRRARGGRGPYWKTERTRERIAAQPSTRAKVSDNGLCSS